MLPRSVSRLTQWSPQLPVSLLKSFFTLRDHRLLPRRTDCPRQYVVHLKSDLYLDGIGVACVASPSVRSRRLETRTCSLCSVGTHSNRHSTCTCTLQVSLRDSVAPPNTSVRLSVTLVATGHQARASVVDLWTHDVCSDWVSLGTLVARSSTRLRRNCVHRPATVIARLTTDSSDHLFALRSVRC